MGNNKWINYIIISISILMGGVEFFAGLICAAPHAVIIGIAFLAIGGLHLRELMNEQDNENDDLY